MNPSIIPVILKEYDIETVKNLIETSMSDLYSNVLPPINEIGNEIRPRPLWRNSSPFYEYFRHKDKTRYASCYTHHTLSIYITTDAELDDMRGCLSMNCVITANPQTDHVETIQYEYEQIRSFVVTPIQERVRAHGDHCQNVFDEVQRDFLCDRDTFL